jgi:hypothetical protein
MMVSDGQGQQTNVMYFGPATNGAPNLIVASNEAPLTSSVNVGHEICLSLCCNGGGGGSLTLAIGLILLGHQDCLSLLHYGIAL